MMGSSGVVEAHSARMVGRKSPSVASRYCSVVRSASGPGMAAASGRLLAAVISTCVS